MRCLWIFNDLIGRKHAYIVLDLLTACTYGLIIVGYVAAPLTLIIPCKWDRVETVVRPYMGMCVTLHIFVHISGDLLIQLPTVSSE